MFCTFFAVDLQKVYKSSHRLVMALPFLIDTLFKQSQSVWRRDDGC